MNLKYEYHQWRLLTYTTQGIPNNKLRKHLVYLKNTKNTDVDPTF